MENVNLKEIVINNYLENIKDNKAALRQFFNLMPKGGDLHNHLTGSAYPETFFEMAVKKGLSVDLETGKLYKEQPSDVETVQLSTTMPDFHNVRMWLIDKWSIRNFQPYKYPLGPDEYFFGTFGLLAALTGDTDDLAYLAHELKLRAAVENVDYLELIGTAPSIPADCGLGEDYDGLDKTLKERVKNNDIIGMTEIIGDVFNLFEKSQMLQDLVPAYLESVKELDEKSKSFPNNIGNGAVDVKVVCRYQGYAVRNLEPLMVFAQLYVVHKACILDGGKLLVGCNIVAAENGEKSMIYYRAHMMMFAQLNMGLAEVNTSLHAGELTLGLIRPEHLTYPLQYATFNTRCQRIGHGVSAPFDVEGLALMKSKDIAIEINLTSNEFILGVKDSEHPFMLYYKAGIPIVICTDDPGILRTSLSEQYTLLVLRYGCTYTDIKKFVNNSVQYSFLNEEDKKGLQSKVDRKFEDFEEEFINIVRMLNPDLPAV